MSAEIIYATFGNQSYRGDEPKILNDARKFSEWPEWKKTINIKLEQLKWIGT